MLVMSAVVLDRAACHAAVVGEGSPQLCVRAEPREGRRVMNARQMVVVSAAVSSVVVLSGCNQPQRSAADRGLCFQQAACAGGAMSGLTTRDQCKTAGGKSWSATQRSCAGL
jgi:hypothetical protein